MVKKTLVHGLSSIKGLGMHMSVLVADSTGIDRNTKIGELKDKQIDKIKETLENLNKNVPGWMVNHRKDLDTGEDIHLIGAEIDMRLRDEINVMKKIRSYKGLRHEQGLPVRGQRTRANNRSGLTLGVSKKGVQQAKKKSSKE
jgi:small subunit ribosomal protein S13